jgi:hypothetical protein
MRRSAANESVDGSNDAAHRGNFAASIISFGRQSVKVPKQLVRSVDEIDVRARVYAARGAETSRVNDFADEIGQIS